MDQDTKTETPPGMMRQHHPGRTSNEPLNPWQERPVPTTNSDTPTTKRTRRPKDEPLPGAPADVMAVLRHGGTAALTAAAASSFVSLFWLATLVGWPKQLAWLLPISLDVYAGTSLYVGYRLPARHAAAKSARRNARFALALTVACNAIYHALVLFGSAWPVWVHDSLLVAVSALPPIVVERLLHLRSKVGNGNAETPATATATGNAVPVATPARVARPTQQATPAVAPAPATPATPAVAASVPETPPAPRPATGNAPIRLVTAAEKDKIVARMLADHGDDVPLAEIAAAIGTPHRATAMKVRDRVIKARSETKPATEGPEDEPEPALGAAV